jgi:hypothetical protein
MLEASVSGKPSGVRKRTWTGLMSFLPRIGTTFADPVKERDVSSKSAIGVLSTQSFRKPEIGSIRKSSYVTQAGTGWKRLDPHRLATRFDGGGRRLAGEHGAEYHCCSKHRIRLPRKLHCIRYFFGRFETCIVSSPQHGSGISNT